MLPEINSTTVIKAEEKNPIPKPAKVILPILIRIFARFSFCLLVNFTIQVYSKVIDITSRIFYRVF